MSPELIAVIIGFVTLLLTNLGMFIQLNVQLNAKIDAQTSELNAKIDSEVKELRQKDDDNFKVLLTRIDAVNARLDNLYHELFKRDIA